MKIAIAQIECKVGDVKANIDKISGIIQKAAEAGSELVMFPEMADTGYEVSRISAYASSWDPGPVEHIQKAAKQNRIHVICGLSELADGCIYNVLAVVNSDGRISGKYRKTHLAAFSPLEEHKTFTAGNCLEIVQIGDFKAGLMICYDLRFPEVARSLALSGAEMLLLAAAWPFPRLRHWDMLIAARAIENQVFVVAANHVGANSMATFCGSSRIVDPYGVTVTSASQEREALMMAEISKTDLEYLRDAMPVFEHRREKLYRDTSGKVL